MAQRKKAIEEFRLNLKEQERIRAGYVKDRYPQVTKLDFHFTFTDPDNFKPPWEKTTTISPEGSALFKFDCPYLECVDGGFDLSSPVRQMIESGRPECSGSLTCQGWQDPERVGKHHCWVGLSYTVTASYAEGSVGKV